MAKTPRPVTNPVNSRFVEGPLKFKNETGGSLTRGTLVYISGIDAATGLRNVAKADSDAQGKAAEWIVLKDVANGGQGVLGKRVRLTGQNTSAFNAAEDPAYLSTTAGAWTATSPIDGDANGLVQIVGHCVVKHASTGVIDLRIPEDPVQVGTNEIQNGAVTAAKLGGDVSATIIVDDVTIELAGGTTARLKDSGITNAKVSASAAIDRSKLATDASQKFPLNVVSDVGAALGAVEAAGTFNRSISSNVHLIQGEIADNETEASVGYAQFTLPPEYVAASNLTLRIPCKVVKTGSANNNGSTIDVEAYESDGAGAVASDICATAAQTFAAMDTWYNKDFTITGTDLVAGDQVNFKITSSIIDSEAGGGTLRFNMETPKLLISVKG